MRLILVLALFAAAPALAQTPDSTGAPIPTSVPRIRASVTSEHIHLDGRLDEDAWSKAESVDRFTQRDPEEGKPVSERTEVKILLGDDALYVGARLYDKDPSKIRRRLVRRDEDLAS